MCLVCCTNRLFKCTTHLIAEYCLVEIMPCSPVRLPMFREHLLLPVLSIATLLPDYMVSHPGRHYLGDHPRRNLKPPISLALHWSPLNAQLKLTCNSCIFSCIPRVFWPYKWRRRDHVACSTTRYENIKNRTPTDSTIPSLNLTRNNHVMSKVFGNASLKF